MSGSPVSGDTNSDQQPLIHYLPTNVSNFTISQFTSPTITPNPNPNPNPNLPPQTVSLGKRRKSKPVRYGGPTTIVEDTNVLEASSTKCLRSQTKCLKSLVMIRANEVQTSLGTERPSCMKTMTKAHVDGYWMGFPQWFGKMFLPKEDSNMKIEDENGEVRVIKYNSDKSGLSGGWKAFVTDHKLDEGDLLIFHLVEPLKFKVYIIRVNDITEADEAHALMTLKTDTEQTDSPSPTKRKSKRPKSLPLITVENKQKLSTPPTEINSRVMEQSGNDSEEVGSEVVEGSRTSKSDLSFQEVGTFEDFHIMFKGTCIDSEFPDDVRMNYYKLCISRNELLHDAIPESTYCKLVVGVIGATVNIANEIKNCELTTTKEEFEEWDKNLKSFSVLGMKVGFLRDRIVTLSRLMFETEGRLDVQRYIESKNQQEHIEDEIISVSLKLVELKEKSRKLKGIVDGLKDEGGRYEEMFEEAVNSPW